MEIVDDREEFVSPEWDKSIPVAVLTQTTLSVDDTENSIRNIQNSFSDVLVRNDLCYATTNRQMAVKEISNHVEIFLVVGAQNSSNCNRLKEVAESNGVPAFLINSVEELDLKWLADVENVGVTSGASTPDSLVRGIIDFINPSEVIEMGGEEENITFTLPKGLRDIRNT